MQDANVTELRYASLLDNQVYDLSLSTYSSYVYSAFLSPINKAAALRYLDDGGPPPERYATVIAVRGANVPPDVMEYKVMEPRLPVKKQSNLLFIATITTDDKHTAAVSTPLQSFGSRLHMHERL